MQKADFFTSKHSFKNGLIIYLAVCLLKYQKAKILRILASNLLVEAREGWVSSYRPIIDLLKQRRALGVLFNTGFLGRVLALCAP